MASANPGASPAPRIPTTAGGTIPAPAQYFGTAIGTDGYLAQWKDMVPYFELIGKGSERVIYQEVGKTTLGNPYVLLTISSPQNLARLDHFTSINARLADPRGLTDAEALQLATEGLPFYYAQAGIHSTEVGNSQAAIEWAYRLATEQSDYMKKLLDNLIILLVPCQNPDGLVLVNDYFAATANTSYSRTYPDLYNKYTGHDDNRDWMMLTQVESNLNISILNKYHPQVFQDSHQAGSSAPRLFTPPYLSPYDINIDPILVQETDTVGLQMQCGMTAAGMKGNGWGAEYDYWTPSRQYCVYHGAARILTEAASCSNLAYPLVGDGPLGSQELLINFIEPYDSNTWTLRNIIDWVSQAFYSGLETVAYDTYNWLYNSYRVAHKAVTRTSPYAYVIEAGQRDPQAVFDALTIFDKGAVEIHQATSGFTAGGKNYPAGSYIIYMQQPYAGFVKTMLEVQDYPMLLQYPGGPPQQPYDVTAQTLPLLLGFTADLIDSPFSVSAKLLRSVTPPAVSVPSPPSSTGAYAFGPESYGVFRIVAALQRNNIPTFRAAASFTDDGRTYPAGTFLVPWVGPVAAYMADGLRTTALLAAVSVAGSVVLGVLLGTVLTLPSKVVRVIVRIYVEVWRGLPIIVILFFIFFALPIIGIPVDTFASAAAGLTLWGSANMAEVVRGAVQSVPRGQAEAAAALGFSWPGRMHHVILPQATRRVLPPLIGLVVNLVQQTSLAAVIGLLDVLEASQRSIERLTLSSGSTHALPILGAVLAVFFVVCFPLTMLSRWYEARLR